MARPAASERRYRVVGFWRRALAGAVDAVLLGPVALGLAVVVATVGGRPPHSWTELGPTWAVELAIEGGAGIAALVMAAIVVLLYHFLFLWLRGQTPGKQLVGVRVVDVWGERPSLGRALLRSAMMFLSVAGAGLGVLWIAADRERRALHDWVAGTYAVRVPRRAEARRTVDEADSSDANVGAEVTGS